MLTESCSNANIITQNKQHLMRVRKCTFNFPKCRIVTSCVGKYIYFIDLQRTESQSALQAYMRTLHKTKIQNSYNVNNKVNAEFVTLKIQNILRSCQILELINFKTIIGAERYFKSYLTVDSGSQQAVFRSQKGEES